MKHHDDVWVVAIWIIAALFCIVFWALFLILVLA